MSVKPWWRETLETVLWAVALALVLRTFVVQSYWIPSGSMIPTLQIRDRVMAAKFWYYFSEPKRGQIVVFKFPDDTKKDFVKRIIGLPGETIEIRDGVVYVNGEPLQEPYIQNHDSVSMNSITVPQDHYFMLGDNRPNSWDGRYWEHQFVSKEALRGPAFFRFWPLPRVGIPK
ncbi:MAG: signal peptidase I [Aminobacterium sp.]|uniref:signal peptidase I n=1 Tax=bioreactor metagenome TaxID=1076179 RepID=A0A645FWF7_9ZZZZ|nr:MULTISPECIES: signal peptidase I [unclassified Aminobacterium]MDD2205923.1 signal peptidase I [Aminobacterium sp.]MDD3708336.1 signal peptidase I [Aminobacterium sp.]MDD4550640.1 signal peptidase I [Aminobacterium sp.]MEA4876598.1 signal peptidase I [Aminobacterium sp.]WMI71882.1 signal peptidase I [Aminobacterium sp. MB27-C1]